MEILLFPEAQPGQGCKSSLYSNSQPQRVKILKGTRRVWGVGDFGEQEHREGGCCHTPRTILSTEPLLLGGLFSLQSSDLSSATVWEVKWIFWDKISACLLGMSFSLELSSGLWNSLCKNLSSGTGKNRNITPTLGNGKPQ